MDLWTLIIGAGALILGPGSGVYLVTHGLRKNMEELTEERSRDRELLVRIDERMGQLTSSFACLKDREGARDKLVHRHEAELAVLRERHRE
mgnify:CR=1 FL=1